MATNGNQRLRIVSALVATVLTLGGLTACSSVMTMVHGGAQKPASRASARPPL